MLLHDIMSCPPCPGAQHSPGRRERERDQFSRPARASVITQLTAGPGVPSQFLTRIGHYQPRALRGSLLSPLIIMWSAAMLRVISAPVSSAVSGIMRKCIRGQAGGGWS